MNTLHTGITRLLRSGLTGEALALPKDFSLEEACPILRKHSVVPLAYQGAVNCGMDPREPVMQKLLMLYYRVLIHHEKQARALDSLFAAFDGAGIPYMPIKGCNLKKLYPKPELRPMGDADILILLEDYGAVRPIMEAQGFSLVADTTHVYEWKRPELLVELHKSMVDKGERDYYAYYGTGWKFAKKGNGTRCDLTPEDSYVFTLVHLAKHYRGGGIGCRHMVDLYVFCEACPELDMAYISRELEKLNLLAFHKNVMRTLDVWFRDREGDPVTEQITQHIFSGGSWGNLQNRNMSAGVKSAQQAGSARNTRIRAWVRAIFPARESMAYSHRILRKYPILLPVFWTKRWFDLLFFRRKTIMKKVHALNEVNDDAVCAYNQALQMVGLTFDKEIWKARHISGK